MLSKSFKILAGVILSLVTISLFFSIAENYYDLASYEFEDSAYAKYMQNLDPKTSKETLELLLEYEKQVKFSEIEISKNKTQLFITLLLIVFALLIFLHYSYISIFLDSEQRNKELEIYHIKFGKFETNSPILAVFFILTVFLSNVFFEKNIDNYKNETKIALDKTIKCEDDSDPPDKSICDIINNKQRLKQN